MSSGQGNPNDNTGQPRNAVEAVPLAVNASSSDNVNRNLQAAIQQPRQPRDMQGLLRFAMEATAAEDPTAPSHFEAMDPERKEFLERALKGMTVDIAEELTTAVQVLKTVSNLTENDDPSEIENAFETISSYVDHIDVANDFHKIGGLDVLKPCLASCHDSIQSCAAELVADLTQNNPYCQTHVLAAGLLPILLRMVDEGVSDVPRIKAMYAVSCLVRDCPAALDELIRLDGCSVLLRAMQSDVEKLRLKAAFLVGALCRQHNTIRDELHSTGWVQQLVSLLAQERTPSHEHVLAALLALIQGHQGALEECRDPQLEVRTLLTKYIELYSGKEECLEEIDYSRQILQLIDSNSSDVPEDR